MNNFSLTIFSLVTCILVGSIFIGLSLRFGKIRFFSISSMAIFLVTLPLSGIAHYLGGEYSFRGYVDLRESNPANGPLNAALMCMIILCVLLIGSSRSTQETFVRLRQYRSIRHLFLIAIAFSVLGFVARLKTSIYVQSLSIDRVVSLDGGNARYAYVSVWLIWGLLFLSWGIFERFRKFLPYGGFVIFITFSSLTWYFLAWSGSRFLPLLFSSIFLIIFWKDFGRYKRRFIAVYFMLTIFLVSVLTTSRIESLSYGKNLPSVLGFFDWQVGRFSIFARVIEATALKGLANGETFLFTMQQTANGILRLVGFTNQALSPDNLSISQYLGDVIYGDSHISYLASGMLIESYLNFGLLGLLTFCILVVYLLNLLQKRFNLAQSTTHRILYLYWGFSLISCVYLSSSLSFVGYFLYYPVPLYLAVIYERKSSPWRQS